MLALQKRSVYADALTMRFNVIKNLIQSLARETIVRYI